MKLKKGLILKNYKELCLYIGWIVSSGNTKIAQLALLDSLCKYHKEGNRFIIDEVYNTVNKVIEHTGLTQDLGIEEIELLLLNKMVQSKSNSLRIQYKQLMMEFNMYNKQFNMYNYNLPSELRYLPKDIAYSLSLDIDTICDALDIAYKSNNKTINKAIAHLCKLGICIKERYLHVQSYENDAENKINEPRMATQREKELFINARKKAMDKYNIASLTQLYSSRMSETDINNFYNYINIDLHEHGIYRMFMATRITYISELAQKELSKRKEQAIKSKLNKNVLATIYDIVDGKKIEDLEDSFSEEISVFGEPYNSRKIEISVNNDTDIKIVLNSIINNQAKIKFTKNK